MRIYLAAPWVFKDEAARAGALLESAGHIITKKWWEHREVPGYIHPPDVSNDELMFQAAEDLAGVFNAQVMVLLNFAVSEGKAVETGLALAYGTPIIVVGVRSNLFHYLPGVTFAKSIEEVIADHLPVYALGR